MIKINDFITYTGVLNPNLRVFDVIMRTEYGTSYNAYTVFGKDKTALIETTHMSFFDSFLNNVNEALDGRTIDFLVLNHCEPDHTGCVARLLEYFPDMTVVVSQAGAIYIKNITNRDDINLLVVKDGDSVDLGGLTLRFLSAPFLHWPDSMFTWVPEAKTLFTCDFLGCHYCEPQIFDTRIAYPAAYREAFQYYYDCIFAPFAQYARKGLDIVRGLFNDIDYICASHGPVLTRDGFMSEALDKYQKRSTCTSGIVKLIPIFYCTAYGNTRLLAEAARKGLMSVIPDVDTPLYDIIYHDMSELVSVMNKSDAFLLGSPTINRDAVPPAWNLLAGMDAINIQKRPVALFGSYGWSGEALPNLAQRLTAVKARVFDKQLKVCFTPSPSDLINAELFGTEFARSLL